MRRRIILIGVLTWMVTGQVEAQSLNQDPTVGELQKQLEEMRTQMAKMQNRIADLEAAKGIAAANPSTDTVLPQSQAPPEQSLRSHHGEARNFEGPTSFHYKGVT